MNLRVDVEGESGQVNLAVDVQVRGNAGVQAVDVCGAGKGT